MKLTKKRNIGTKNRQTSGAVRLDEGTLRRVVRSIIKETQENAMMAHSDVRDHGFDVYEDGGVAYASVLSGGGRGRFDLCSGDSTSYHDPNHPDGFDQHDAQQLFRELGNAMVTSPGCPGCAAAGQWLLERLDKDIQLELYLSMKIELLVPPNPEYNEHDWSCDDVQFVAIVDEFNENVPGDLGNCIDLASNPTTFAKFIKPLICKDSAVRGLDPVMKQLADTVGLHVDNMISDDYVEWSERFKKNDDRFIDY
jgi:hypothetical protein